MSGFFRLPNDLPKPVWRYPTSYLAFHMYATQVSSISNFHLSVGPPAAAPACFLSILNILCSAWTSKQQNQIIILEFHFIINTWWAAFWVQGMFKNDFLGLTFGSFILNGEAITPKIPGYYVVEQIYGIQTKRGKWMDLGILLGMTFMYRLLFLICIKLNEDFQPLVHSYMMRYRTKSTSSKKIKHKKYSDLCQAGGVLIPATSSPSLSPFLHSSHASKNWHKSGKGSRCRIVLWQSLPIIFTQFTHLFYFIGKSHWSKFSLCQDQNFDFPTFQRNTKNNPIIWNCFILLWTIQKLEAYNIIDRNHI